MMFTPARRSISAPEVRLCPRGAPDEKAANNNQGEIILYNMFAEEMGAVGSLYN